MEGTETFEMSDKRKTIWSIYSANSKSLVISSIFCNICILWANTVPLHLVYVYSISFYMRLLRSRKRYFYSLGENLARNHIVTKSHAKIRLQVFRQLEGALGTWDMIMSWPRWSQDQHQFENRSKLNSWGQ